MKLAKKGQVFSQLTGLATAIAMLVIVFAVIFLIAAETQTQIADVQGITNTSNTSSLTTAYNGTVTLVNAAADIPGWVPLIVIAVIGSILLGLVALFRTR